MDLKQHEGSETFMRKGSDENEDELSNAVELAILHPSTRLSPLRAEIEVRGDHPIRNSASRSKTARRVLCDDTQSVLGSGGLLRS